MEYIIYHKADLDGMASAAIFYNNQVMYGENAKLFPYDYGQKLDTRLFKGKSAVMVDVSMDMERMELLGNSCLEFIWIDHHISAFNKVFDHCQEKEYGMVSKRINDLITMIQVQKMNLTYYFSKQISACEISAKLFPGNMGKRCAEIINTLGQYDTWRKTEEEQLSEAAKAAFVFVISLYSGFSKKVSKQLPYQSYNGIVYALYILHLF